MNSKNSSGNFLSKTESETVERFMEILQLKGESTDQAVNMLKLCAEVGFYPLFVSEREINRSR